MLSSAPPVLTAAYFGYTSAGGRWKHSLARTAGLGAPESGGGNVSDLGKICQTERYCVEDDYVVMFWLPVFTFRRHSPGEFREISGNQRGNPDFAPFAGLPEY